MTLSDRHADDFAADAQRGPCRTAFISRVNLQTAPLPPAPPSAMLRLKGSWRGACVQHAVSVLNRNSLAGAKWKRERRRGTGTFPQNKWLFIVPPVGAQAFPFQTEILRVRGRVIGKQTLKKKTRERASSFDLSSNTRQNVQTSGMFY